MTAEDNEQQISRSWFRRSRRDPYRLARLLAQDIPPAAAGIPARITFGLSGILGIVGYLVGPALSFLVLHFVFDFKTPLGLFLAAVSALLEVAAALPRFDNLNRAVSASAEGLRLEKVHRSYVIPWWQMRSIEATPDVERVRARGDDSEITFTTTGVPAQEVDNLVLAIRGHAAERGMEVSEMTRGQRIRDTIIPTVCRIGAAGILLFGLYTTLPGTLGIRCSVNSAYLQARYETPDRQGCVVLRVSAGAAKAGVRVGDLMVEFEGYPVTSGQQFSAIFDQSEKPWDVTVIRRGESEPLRFKVEGGWGKTFQEDKDDPIFYYLRARWNAQEDASGAIQDYGRAIELDPRFELAFLYRGQLYADRGDAESATKDLGHALELSPELGEVHSIYSFSVALTDSEARQHIEEAIRLHECDGAFEGMNVDCAIDYVQFSDLQLSDDPRQAVESALQSIRFYDGYAHPYFVAACGFSLTNRPEDGQEYARKYLQFPKSERMDTATAAAKVILSGEGVC
jgi:hypothetical protein